MATLADKLSELRGGRTYVEFSRDTGVNRQTLNDVENGDSIRLETLRQIAKACGVSNDQWVEFLILWIRTSVGEEEFRKLDIRPASEAGVTEDGKDVRALLLRLFGSASATHQLLVLRALSAPEIMDCLASITRLANTPKPDNEPTSTPVEEAAKRKVRRSVADEPSFMERMMTGVGSLLSTAYLPAAKTRSPRKRSPQKRAKKIPQKK